MELKKMVEVVGARKKYGQTVVFNNLNMNVPRATIYGLLGPSGCGKTTLLSCLVGRKHLDSGTIRLGVCKRKQIGFMPQDVALFPELNVEEIFTFYGRIFGLDSYTIEYRIIQLTNILELPPKYQKLRTMSGGQQRRVSLAVTLLHNPQLIILDEPTVGLDPILAHNVWQYLLRLSNKENKTIIITTHYIEEAGQSHIIGLMREGTLLVEASPQYLMSSLNSTTLEEAFLNLCKKQQVSAFNSVAKLPSLPNQREQQNGGNAILTEGSFKINRFWAQLTRNTKFIFRNTGMLMFILLLPLLEALLYCVAFGKEPSGLSLGVVSEEPLNTCSLLPPNVTYNSVLGCSVPTSLPCQFVTHLAAKSNIVYFDSIVEAKNSVASRVVWGALHFNPNFTEAFIARLSDGISTDDIILDQGVVSVWMDMSDYIISNQLRQYIMETLIDYIKHVLEICGINPNIGNIPIKFKDPIYGEASDHGFSTSGLPGLLCSFIFSLPLTFTSGAIVMDKTSGLYDRNFIAGITRLEVVVAHLIVQIVVVATQTGIMSFIVYAVFEHRVLGDTSLVILIMSSVASVGISYGFLLAEVFSHDTPVNYTAIGSTLTLLLTSGILWPIEGGHYLIRSWVKLIPVVAAVESLTGVSIKGYSLYHPSVYIGLISSATWTVVFSVLTYIFYKVNNR